MRARRVIEDHRPLLARLRELAPQSELLALSKRFVSNIENEILKHSKLTAASVIKFIDIGVTLEVGTNGGGHGQGNGTAG